MTSTMDLADHYATLTADVAATTAARAALEQRIKELEANDRRYQWLRSRIPGSTYRICAHCAITWALTGTI